MPNLKMKLNREASDIAQMNTALSRILIQSLSNYQSDVQTIIKHSRSLNCWSNALQGNHSAKLVSEIFVDLYVSIHFSLCALYKYADMALRSALENSLNLAYFCTHPVEFRWWEKGREWYPKRGSQHPWGEAYNYFRHLGSELTDSKANEILVKHVSHEYRELSRSIHSSSLRLQTAGAKLSPSMDARKFKSWALRVRKVLSIVNAVLILSLHDRFRNMNKADKELIVSAILREHKKALESMNLL